MLSLNMQDCLVPNWQAPSRVHALITTRVGGVSEPPYGQWHDGLSCSGGLNLNTNNDDKLHCIKENRARLAMLAGVPIAWLEQVHGTQVVRAETVLAQQAKREAIARADACVTAQTQIGCAVVTADCLPVLICDQAGQAVGAAHAGWRGLVAGVIENTATQVAALAGNSALSAFLGPAIGQQAFEVGADVLDAFMQAATPIERNATAAAFHPHPDRPNKYLANIYQLARLRLARLDIQSVDGGQWCTASDPARFYSYRRDGVKAGFASLIWLG